MDCDGTPSTLEEFDQPAFDARVVRSGPKLGAPAGNFTGGHARDLTVDVLGESGAQVALCVDEPDQECAATRVHLMNGVGPHPDRTAFPPWFRSRAAYL